jgi:hypothetical protein
MADVRPRDNPCGFLQNFLLFEVVTHNADDVKSVMERADTA